MDRGGGRYDVRMSWSSRNAGGAGVDYFAVKLDQAEQKVAGTVNDAYFDDVPLGDHYFASVQAFSRTGSSDETVVREPRRATGYAHDPAGRGSFYPWTVCAAFVLCCTAALAVGGQYAYGRWAADGGAATAGAGYDMAALRGLDDVDVVLRPEDVIVSDVVLGHGNFGEVRKAVLKTEGGGECPVAVKWLRDHPTGRDTERFVHEILLMQMVGKHANIVSMIGCCLDVNKRCMLVVEYCPLGDLQTYLKKVSEYSAEHTDNRPTQYYDGHRYILITVLCALQYYVSCTMRILYSIIRGIIIY